MLHWIENCFAHFSGAFTIMFLLFCIFDKTTIFKKWWQGFIIILLMGYNLEMIQYKFHPEWFSWLDTSVDVFCNIIGFYFAWWFYEKR